MPQFITEYANRADDGAHYVGPMLVADSWADAEALLDWVKGPNSEPLTIRGEMVSRLPADVNGDTFTIVKPRSA